MDKFVKKEDLEKLYDDNPNNLANVFLSAGYTEDYVEKMFNKSSREMIIIRAMKIIETFNSKKSNFDEELYHIPEKYNVPEIEFLNEDRNDMYNEMNNSINKQTGEILQSLYDFENDKYIIGLHRTASSKEEIFNKGVRFDSLDLNDHIQVFSNFPFFLREIKYCESYKMSNGCFVIKIPKKDIKGSISDAEPIYYKNKDGNIYLRPEFICAYIPVSFQKIGKVQLNNTIYNLYDDNTKFYYNEYITDAKKIS